MSDFNLHPRARPSTRSTGSALPSSFWVHAKSYRVETKEDWKGGWTVDYYCERAMDPCGPWIRLENMPTVDGHSSDEALSMATLHHPGAVRRRLRR